MMRTARAYYEDSNDPSPLDNLEEVLCDHNWTFERLSDDELMVRVTGKACEYTMFFIWHAEMGALQLCVQYDIDISEDKRMAASDTLRYVNETVWMGHFDLPASTGVPSFRHTMLMANSGSSAESIVITDLVDIALTQCERFYPLFELMAHNDIPQDQNVFDLALMDTAGES